MERIEPDNRLVVAATYERTVHASLERVWENVLDWEHLPWLHARVFDTTDGFESGDWGWRGMLGAAGGGAPSSVELIVDRDASRYVVRTGSLGQEGSPAASEIWTSLSPIAEHRTHVEVDFRVPPLPEDALNGVGQIYVSVYTALWDEDEEMMQERAERLRECLEAPADTPVDLGSPVELRARLPVDVVFGGNRFRVIDRDGAFFVHASVCPHLLGPLHAVDEDSGTLQCPWHGYAFDADAGRSRDGHNLRLPSPPRVDLEAVPGRCTLVEVGS